MGECYQALSPRRASGEAFGFSEALGVRFCGPEKAQGTSLGHLGVRKVWQIWILLLVAKSGVGFLQNLKNRKKISVRKLGTFKEIRELEYIFPATGSPFLDVVKYR